jgi:hypothetical protein
MMKIVGPGPAQPAAVRRREGPRAASGEGFAVSGASDAQARAAGAVSGPDAINGLFALQEVEGDGRSPRRQLARRGEDILDRLDEIRHGLLVGALPRERVQSLLSLVRSHRAHVHDPRLMEIIDEIELRAEVELAKLAPLT